MYYDLFSIFQCLGFLQTDTYCSSLNCLYLQEVLSCDLYLQVMNYCNSLYNPDFLGICLVL